MGPPSPFLHVIPTRLHAHLPGAESLGRHDLENRAGLRMETGRIE